MLTPFLAKDRKRAREKESLAYEDVTHILRGMGLGLLAYSALKGRARAFGYILLGLAALFHFYGVMAAKSKKTDHPTESTESQDQLAA